MIAVVSCGHRPDDERIYHRQIKSLLKAGEKICYFTRFDGEMNLTENGLNHENVSRSRNSVNTFAKLVETALIQNPPDVVHVHEFELLPMVGRVKKSTGAKILYDVHDTLKAMWDTVSSRSGISKKIVNTGLALYEKHHLKYVDHVILANHPFETSIYENAGYPTTIVPNFPLLSYVREQKANTKKILYQGLLSKDRGIEILIDAFGLILESHPDAELILLGPAKTEQYREYLENIIIGKSNQIHIINDIPHADVWGFMAEAKIGVIPSLDSPRVRCDTPTKLFEYMATDCAVVATDLKPVRYHAGENALYVIPNDPKDLSEKIISVFKSESLYNRLTQQSKNLITEKFNWENVESRFLEVIEQLKA